MLTLKNYKPIAPAANSGQTAKINDSVNGAPSNPASAGNPAKGRAQATSGIRHVKTTRHHKHATSTHGCARAQPGYNPPWRKSGADLLRQVLQREATRVALGLTNT